MPSDARYFANEEERGLLRRDPDNEDEENSEPQSPTTEYPPPADPRFTEPTPAPWKRAALIAFIVLMFWFAYKLQAMTHKPKVVHASRYSREHKYRPAASPVITETLSDGRLRVRGAYPTAEPKPTPEKKKRNTVKKTKKKKHNKAKRKSF